MTLAASFVYTTLRLKLGSFGQFLRFEKRRFQGVLGTVSAIELKIDVFTESNYRARVTFV